MSTTTAMYADVTLSQDGQLRGTHFRYSSPMQFISDLRMETIKVVFEETTPQAAMAIYDAQDGYGEPGFIPSQGYDWSGIRDSSEEAKNEMFAIAQQHFSLNGMAAILGLDADQVRQVAAANYR